MNKGTVTVGRGQRSNHLKIPIVYKGDCFDNLIAMLSKNKGMGLSEAAKVRDKTVETVGKIVQCFSGIYGAGIVGKTQSNRPLKRRTNKQTIGETGLLYGKVQSGKTNVAIATVALSSANGFKLFIVLTSDNVWLGKQTYDRFKSGLLTGGPKVTYWEDWKTDPKAWARKNFEACNHGGLVLVTTKNNKHLAGLIEALNTANAVQYPALIIDDEADNASLDTNRNNPQRERSSINGLIGKIREKVFHNIYLQVTATPQSLLLQGIHHPWQPGFVIMIHPGQDYMGGDLFFGRDIKLNEESIDVEPTNHVKFVSLSEVELLKEKGRGLPAGMTSAIATFLVGFAHKKTEDDDPKEIFSFLAHISHKQGSHLALKERISSHIDEIHKALRSPRTKAYAEITGSLKLAHQELQKTCKKLTGLKIVVATLMKYLNNASTSVINASSTSSEPSYSPGMNFLIGGNKFGRGVTIEGLTVTYYGRLAQQSQMDTVHQHARMFGYRKDLEDVTRLYLPKEIYMNFRKIHYSDEATRKDHIGDNHGNLKVFPVWIGKNLKPTRSNVIPLSNLKVRKLDGSDHPWLPEHRGHKVRQLNPKIENLLKKIKCPEFPEMKKVKTKDILALLDFLPSERKHRSWNSDEIKSIVSTLATIPNGIEEFYITSFLGSEVKRNESSNARGFLPPSVHSACRNKILPVLVMQQILGENTKLEWKNNNFYVPTIYWPKTKYAVVSNHEE